jgi:hypothetical protein
MKETELKPCKCGCKAEVVESQAFSWCDITYYARCTSPDCEERTELKYEHKIDAINAWNRKQDFLLPLVQKERKEQTMSREKQIEEMVKVLIDYTKKKNIMASHVILEDYAEELYNAGYRKIPENIGEYSDGYHTFNELYHHRAVLFSVICNMFPEKAWKSKLHDTGDMFDGMFIVGIETEQGQATYHYDIEPYWDMFKVKELEKAPKWDGHTPSDAIQRIGSISSKQSEGEWIKEEPWDVRGCVTWRCSVCKKTFRDTSKYCPNCGAKMKGGAE